MLWSSVTIPGRPTILMVDASRNQMGWEFEYCDRLFASMKRRGLHLEGSAPVRVKDPEELLPHLEAWGSFNCILLFGHGQGANVAPETKLSGYWACLNSHVRPADKLFAASMWESP